MAKYIKPEADVAKYGRHMHSINVLRDGVLTPLSYGSERDLRRAARDYDEETVIRPPRVAKEWAQ